MDFTVRLMSKEIIATDIMVARFEKPAGFTFLPGQFSFMTVSDIGFNDKKGLRRPLSIASSPLETEIMFVVRLTGSGFKTSLRDLKKGQSITVTSPMGLFTLPESTSVPLVFLAGGLGITPFRSMVAYIVGKRTGHGVTLLYSSRSPEEAVFLNELRDFEQKNNEITVVPTVTRLEVGKRWQGLTGRISPDMIRKGCNQWQSALFYLAGPPAMVDGMKGALDQMGVGLDSVKIEKWVGY